MAERITRRKLIAALPLTALGVAVLSACGASATPTPAATATKAPVAAPPTTAPIQAAAATATSAPVSDLAADQTLRLVAFTLPAFLNPAREGGSLRMMTQNTFRPPFFLDKDSKQLPGICTKWDVSADGLKYTLTMDPNAKFSDGSKVTAADLKFSWEYLTYPETKSGTAAYLTAPIVGYADVVAAKSKDLPGLVAKDEGTLEITLGKPYTPFAKAFSTFIAGVIKKDNTAGGDGWDAKPITCGPYQVDSWNKDTGEVNWSPNKFWWGAKPTITKVNYRYVQDPNTQSIMYDNNEVDIISASDILSAQFKKGPHANELQKVPYGGSYFFYFKTTRKPMDDPLVRKAFQQAIDMGKVVQAVFQGSQDPAYGIISPNLEGYTNPKAYYDPAAAKKALADSTYKTASALPPLTVRVGTNLPEYIRVAEACQQMWKDTLGVDVTISQFDSTSPADNGSAQIFRASLGTLVNDTAAAVSAMGLSTNSLLKTNVETKNTQLDDMLGKADSLPLAQQAERISLYQQAEKIIMDQAYYVPIIWVQYYFAIKPWVKNAFSNTDLSLYNIPQMAIGKH